MIRTCRASSGPEAAGTQVKEGIRIELAGGCTVTAADIIGKDLEFRFGVDLCGAGQQQIATVECRNRAHGTRLHDDPAIEYAAAVASGKAAKDLPAGGVRCAMFKACVIVDMPVTVDEKCTVNGRCTGAGQRTERSCRTELSTEIQTGERHSVASAPSSMWVGSVSSPSAGRSWIAQQVQAASLYRSGSV